MSRSDRRGPPRTLIELLGNIFGRNVIGHWDRVLQLAFLMVVPLFVLLALAGAVVTAAMYLRMDPVRWAAVGGCVSLFLAVATARRRLGQGRRPAAKRPKTRSGSKTGSTS